VGLGADVFVIYFTNQLHIKYIQPKLPWSTPVVFGLCRQADPVSIMSRPMEPAGRLSVLFQDALARITLTHPPLNVFDFQQMDELAAALKQIEQRQEIIAVVLTGGEHAFSAGVDVAVHTPDKVQTMLQKFHGLILALIKFPKITIAEVHGACLGGGAE